jgi:two-component system cell cycle response regulator PopA
VDELAQDARIVIVSKDEFIVPLSDGLAKLGWPAVVARSVAAATAAVSDRQIEAAIVDLACGPDFAALGGRLKEASAPRHLPAIAIGDAADAGDGFDLVLGAPLHPAQAALRLESLVRMAVAEEEFELRRRTFAERGRTLQLPRTT